MTTNLAECINSVSRSALPICALVKTTFKRAKDSVVE